MSEPRHGSPARAESSITARYFLLLVLLVLAVFHRTVGGEFLAWDDDAILSGNPHLKGLSWEQLKWIFTGTDFMWRYLPLSWLTWSALMQCFGLRPFYFHAAVLLIHAANSGLVFLLIRKLLLCASQCSEKDAPRHLTPCAALAAALWAVHPLRVETTAWAVELAFVLPTFFLLLSLLCYLRAHGPGAKPAAGFYWASVAWLVVSLASYPLALGAGAIYVAFDLYPLRRLSLNPGEWTTAAARRVWLEKIPFAVAILFFGWLNLRVRGHSSATWAPPSVLADFGLASRIMQAFFIWAYYFWKPLWPLHLTPVPTQLIEFNPLDAPFVLSAVLVIGLTVLLAWQRHRWPALFAVWFCHLALLVPMLGMSEHPHYASDRYSLVVGIGWSILAGGFLLKIWPREQARWLALPTFGVAIVIFGFLSYRQTLVWQTSVSLFQHILAPWKDEPKLAARRLDIQMRLARAYRQQGDFTNAVAALRTAIQIGPNHAPAHIQLGDTFLESGEPEAAQASFTDAARLDSQFSPPFNDIGVAYARQGKLDRAIEEFAEVLRVQPENRSALRNMATALQTEGKTNEAEIYSRKLKSLPAAPPTR